MHKRAEILIKMNRYLLLILFFLSLPELLSAQTTGCYSQPPSGLGRLYYQRISGNNYASAPFATSGSSASCSSFTSLTVTTTPCLVNGTSTTYLFLATANVPVTCLPLDEHTWLVFPFGILCFFYLQRKRFYPLEV